MDSSSTSEVSCFQFFATDINYGICIQEFLEVHTYPLTQQRPAAIVDTPRVEPEMAEDLDAISILDEYNSCIAKLVSGELDVRLFPLELYGWNSQASLPTSMLTQRIYRTRL